MKFTKLLLIGAFSSFVLSLVATLASFNYSYNEPHIVDAAFVYRGWPSFWFVESWSFWSPPPYPYHSVFLLQNFLMDLGFWWLVFQVPTFLVLFWRRAKALGDKSLVRVHG